MSKPIHSKVRKGHGWVRHSVKQINDAKTNEIEICWEAGKRPTTTLFINGVNIGQAYDIPRNSKSGRCPVALGFKLDAQIETAKQYVTELLYNSELQKALIADRRSELSQRVADYREKMQQAEHALEDFDLATCGW